jgi:ribosomal protein S27AE
MKKEKVLAPSYKVEAKTKRSPAFGGVYWIISPGRLKCGSCGNTEFRVVIDHTMTPHFYCARCGCEHKVYIEEGEGFDDE